MGIRGLRWSVFILTVENQRNKASRKMSVNRSSYFESRAKSIVYETTKSLLNSWRGRGEEERREEERCVCERGYVTKGL